jgi:hypothetical protein
MSRHVNTHIYVVNLENPETSRREFWHLLRYQFCDNFLVLFISVLLVFSLPKPSTNYTQSTNRAHSVSQAPLLSQNALLGYCDEVLKSLMRQSLLFSYVLPSVIKKAKWGGGGTGRMLIFKPETILCQRTPANNGRTVQHLITKSERGVLHGSQRKPRTSFKRWILFVSLSWF